MLDGNPVLTAGQVVWAATLGLFYGYVTLKTGSLLPAMIVHYLGNLFISAINGYVQANASIQAVAVYGVVFTFGIIPTILMMLWTRLFTRWPILQKSWRECSTKKIGFWLHAPNTACTGRRGFVTVFEHSSGFEFFLLPNIVHAPPRCQ